MCPDNKNYMALYIPKDYTNILGTVENTEKAIKAVKDMFQESLAAQLAHRVAGQLRVEAIVFSNVHGVLGKTRGASELAWKHANRKEGK